MGSLLGSCRLGESDLGVCPGRGEEENPDQSIFNRAMQMPREQKGESVRSPELSREVKPHQKPTVFGFHAQDSCESVGL